MFLKKALSHLEPFLFYNDRYEVCEFIFVIFKIQ